MLPPIANRFIAGKTLDSALSYTQSYRDKGVNTMFNLLGEHYGEEESSKANSDAEEYKRLIEETGDTDGVSISVKPSQLGLDFSEETFSTLLEDIVSTAYENDIFVWVDMEDSETTDTTLNEVVSLAAQYEFTVGVAIQANLRRTENDLQELDGSGVAVRLVKGAYNEPEEIAFTDTDKIDEQYKKHMEYLFKDFDGYFAVASHDPEMIDYAKHLSCEYKSDFEFQMLLGVRESVQVELSNNGYSVWQYAPYGSRWKSYVYRRLREGKKNWKFILRALLSSE